VAQLWRGLPGPSTPRTWIRRARAHPVLLSDGRTALYRMEDPLSVQEQLFRFRFEEVRP
jgi:hypothetical protein